MSGWGCAVIQDDVVLPSIIGIYPYNGHTLIKKTSTAIAHWRIFDHAVR